MSKDLIAYIEQSNMVTKLWKRDGTFDINQLTDADAREIAERLECDMSPENLCCDGEAPMSYVRARAKLLQGAQQDLVKLFPEVAT